ncbi:hypothetical protein CK489_38020 [Bradyrhizobium sp. UFLA03-84]|nr:hypothetical protein CK489_38020 [Bradyrhizobium sp. UFLA03-84]
MPGATPGIHVFDTIHEQDSSQARLYNQDLRLAGTRASRSNAVQAAMSGLTGSSCILRSEGQQQ